MKREIFGFTGHGGTALPAYIWEPEGKIKGVLQIAHGMTEHMGRYESFAEDLTEQGFVVAGFDLRGHGKNPGSDTVASCGEGGWAASIGDMRLFFELLEERFGKAPHFMLGFSLGSFLLREYLTQYPDGVAGAIIMGTGHQPAWLLSIMMSVVKGQMKKAGFDGTTDLVRQLSFGTYNQKFKPNRTTADWLCSDSTQLDRYLADPLVRKDISAGLFWELLGSMKRAGRICTYTMPVLLISGKDDPVGDFGKGVQSLYDRMKKNGTDATLQFFPNTRHDLLHEEADGTAATVRKTIAAWITK